MLNHKPIIYHQSIMQSATTTTNDATTNAPQCVCCFIDLNKMCCQIEKKPIITCKNCCRCALNKKTIHADDYCNAYYLTLAPCDCILSCCLSVQRCCCSYIYCCNTSSTPDYSPAFAAHRYTYYNCCFINCINLYECIIVNTYVNKWLAPETCCAIYW